MSSKVLPLLAAAALGGVTFGAGVGLGFSFTKAALGFGSSLLLSALSPKPASSASAPLVNAQTLTIRQPVPARQVIFGESRVPGAMTFAEVSYSNLWLVITLSGHTVSAIPEIYFGDDRVPFASEATAPAYPGVTTGAYANVTALTRALGDETTQPFPGFIAETTGWLDSDRQSGCAKVAWRVIFAPGYWASGLPNLTAHVRGAKVYDPRTALTEWTSNPALIIAHYLCNADYGVGADYSTTINETLLIEQADVCDERVRIAGLTGLFTADADSDVLTFESAARNPLTRTGVRLTTTGTLPAGLATGTTYYCIYRGFGRVQLAATDDDARNGVAIDITDAGSGTHTLQYWDEPRYTANGHFTVDVTPDVVIQQLEAAMAGHVLYANGQYHIRAGAYVAPTVTLDEGDVRAAMKVGTMVSAAQSANGVKGQFVNPAGYWQPDDFPAVDSDAYLEQDQGVRQWADLDLKAFIRSRSQAQRLAKIHLLRLRNSLTFEQTFSLAAFAAMTGGTVGIDYARAGWSGKAFEILQTKLIPEPDGGLLVSLSGRETAAAIYDWNYDEESDADPTPNVKLDLSVGPPGQPAVTEEVYETREGRTLAVKAIVTYAQSSIGRAVSYQLEYKSNSADTWTVLPLVRPATGSSSAIVQEIPDFSPGRWDFRVKAIGLDGTMSAYSTTSNVGIVGLSARPGTPTIAGMERVGGRAYLRMTEAAEADVRKGGHWIVRHSEATTIVAAVWEESFSIGEPSGYPAGQLDIVLPLKGGTYLVKSQDSEGRQCASPAKYNIKRAALKDFTTLDDLAEDTVFGGSHSGTIGTGGVLKLAGAGLFDDIPDLDAVPDWDAANGVTESGTYTFGTGFDFGAVENVRITSQIEGFVVNTLDRFDSRLDDMDDWPDFDGTAGGSNADAWLEARETDDDPAGSPTWSDWRRVDSDEYTCRGMQFRARLATADTTFNIHVEVLRVSADTSA